MPYYFINCFPFVRYIIIFLRKEILRGHGIDITENEDQILDILSKNRSQYARTDNDEW